MTQSTTTPIKSRVLTPDEIALADDLAKNLSAKSGAKIALQEAEREIGRLTVDINKHGFTRASAIWGEARERIGLPQAPKQADLLRK